MAMSWLSGKRGCVCVAAVVRGQALAGVDRGGCVGYLQERRRLTSWKARRKVRSVLTPLAPQACQHAPNGQSHPAPRPAMAIDSYPSACYHRPSQ